MPSCLFVLTQPAHTPSPPPLPSSTAEKGQEKGRARRGGGVCRARCQAGEERAGPGRNKTGRCRCCAARRGSATRHGCRQWQRCSDGRAHGTVARTPRQQRPHPQVVKDKTIVSLCASRVALGRFLWLHSNVALALTMYFCCRPHHGLNFFATMMENGHCWALDAAHAKKNANDKRQAKTRRGIGGTRGGRAERQGGRPGGAPLATVR